MVTKESYSVIRHEHCENCGRNQLCEMILENSKWQGICLVCSSYIYSKEVGDGKRT